ncbi:uncharacterized protein At4g38062-like [Lotus japonicus]|uniref:uncharacterized protein At4g38062-like n=1 Tax=Lotus japonicus TaxID=34305 RepID=UPI00258BBF18|nr:uncharacterized protein At4g38062-like [Lotus japonicus]
MNRIYEELNEAKAETEKLKVELRGKTDSLQDLNKSHDAQVSQIQEAILKVEELEQGLLEKADEINYAKPIHEDLNGNLISEESIITHLSAAKDKLRADCDEKFKKLEYENSRLVCEKSEIEFELQIWKSFVERLKNDLEENLVMRKALENSLLAQVDYSESLKQEKDSLAYKLEEEHNRIDDLQKHVFLLEQELKLRELESAVTAKGNMERTNELEEENRNMRIDELMLQVTSLEQNFTSSLTSFSSQLAEKQSEINLVQEACDYITAAEILAELEMEEKKLMIGELEDEIHDIEHKLKLQDENWSQLKQLALEIEVEMDAKQLNVKNLTQQMENKLRGSDVLIQKLKMENRSLLENATMWECTTNNTQLVDVLRSTGQCVENDCQGMKSIKDDGLLVKENLIMQSSTGIINKPETFCYLRLPLKELNN